MIVALDIETTGLDTRSDRIIEIALVKIDEKDFSIVDSFTTLINPEIEIPKMITNIINISGIDVIDAPIWSEVVHKIEDFIEGYPVLGHNIGFDTGFLRNNGILLEKNIEIDTFDFANFLFSNEKSLNLEYLGDALGFPFLGAHRALNDVHATIELFKVICERMNAFSPLRRSFFEFVALLSENKSFIFVYNDILERAPKRQDSEEFVKMLLKRLSSKQSKLSRSIDSLTEDLGLEVFIANHEILELRENQKKMSTIVSHALSSETKEVIEAPTGIGKTFAYLLPAIIHSIKTGEQVHISTSTKALQDQIIYKDLAFLAKELGKDFSYTKLKGKKNYLSVAGFLSFFTVTGNILSKQETSFILKVLFWLLETRTGELDELDYYGKEYAFLHEIASDDGFTFSKDNPFKKYEFGVLARNNAKKANIVVINNNILFQDIEGDNSILGRVDNLILDEAHTLEDVVTSSLKKGFFVQDIEQHLGYIEKILKKNKFFPEGFSRQSEKILFEMSVLFDYMSSYLNKNSNTGDKNREILVKEDFFSDIFDNADKNKLSLNIQVEITEMLDLFSTLSDTVYLSLQREIEFFEMVIFTLQVFLNPEETKYIKLINYRERRGGLGIEYTLLNVGNYLEKQLWSSLNSCVITSATLQIGKSFSYLDSILSLENFEKHTLESDFNYNTQALLFVPNDLGNIKNNIEQVGEFLLKLCLISGGNTLVLFTAFYSIKQVFAILTPELKKKNINVYAQGVGGGKHKLIEAFKKKADSSILLGTDSFWEGVDIPGKDLQYLCIHKAPFMVPNDPIFQARSVLFSNAFKEYSIPKCILKLKQGFGRLIRTKQDTGVVIFLDDRIHSTHWGDLLYDAFPEDIKIRVAPTESFLEILSKQKKL